jgi:hypothetical protein
MSSGVKAVSTEAGLNEQQSEQPPVDPSVYAYPQLHRRPIDLGSLANELVESPTPQSKLSTSWEISSGMGDDI